jgi:hypothetical protein
MRIKLLFTVAYFFLLSLVSLEFLKYRGIIANYFFIDFRYFAIFFLMGIGAFRVFQPKLVNKWWLVSFNNRIVLQLTTLLTVLLVGLESWNYTNFVFSRFGVNYFILIDLLLLSFFFFIFTSPITSIKKYWQVWLFCSFLLVSYYIYCYSPFFFSDLSRSSGGVNDDNFMEWLQVVVLSVGAVLSAYLAYISKTNLILKLMYVMGVIIFIMLIGEEISWGERFLTYNISSGSGNYQQEFNLHNQEGLNEVTALLYIGAFLYGLLSWLLRLWADKRNLLSAKYQAFWDLLCFKGQEVLYLLPTFLLNPYADRTLFEGVSPILDMYYQWGLVPDFLKALDFLSIWRETFEVLFYAAFVLHLFTIFRQMRNSLNSRQTWKNIQGTFSKNGTNGTR